jgi:hypothetical protein
VLITAGTLPLRNGDPDVGPTFAAVRRMRRTTMRLSDFVYRGTKDGVAAENTIDVTRRTKTILGVQAVVVVDIASVAGKRRRRRRTGTHRTTGATSGISAKTPSTS